MQQLGAPLPRSRGRADNLTGRLASRKQTTMARSDSKRVMVRSGLNALKARSALMLCVLLPAQKCTEMDLGPCAAADNGLLGEDSGREPSLALALLQLSCGRHVIAARCPCPHAYCSGLLLPGALLRA